LSVEQIFFFFSCSATLGSAGPSGRTSTTKRFLLRLRAVPTELATEGSEAGGPGWQGSGDGEDRQDR